MEDQKSGLLKGLYLRQEDAQERLKKFSSREQSNGKEGDYLATYQLSNALTAIPYTKAQAGLYLDSHAITMPAGAKECIGASTLLAKSRRAPQSATVDSRRATNSAPQRYDHSFQPRGVVSRGRPEDLGTPASSQLPRAQSASSHPTNDNSLAQKAMVRQWYSLLQGFKGQKDSLEFVYLRRASSTDVASTWNPFLLEIVPHSCVRGLNDYFTMSPAGVTHFMDGGSTFVTLEQFEREYFQYTQLMRLKLFRQFKMWKSYKMWRKFVHQRKAGDCRDVLGLQVFILDPVFRAALLDIRTSCEELRTLNLHGLTPGCGPLTLEEFRGMKSEAHENARLMLSDFSIITVERVAAACVAALTALDQKLYGLGDGKEKTAEHMKKGPMVKVMAMIRHTSNAEFSYAAQAARRSEKRRMHSFVRLLDYMIAGVLGDILISSLAHVLDRLIPAKDEKKEPELQKEPSSVHEEDSHIDVTSNLSNKWAVPPPPPPLLRVDILLQGGEISLSPPRSSFVTAFTEAMSLFVSAVSIVPPLMGARELTQYLERPVEGVGMEMEGFHDIVVGGESGKLMEGADAALGRAFDAAEEYARSFLRFRDWVIENKRVSFDSMRAEVNAGKRDLERFREDILKYQQQVVEISKVPSELTLGILHLRLTHLISVLQPSPARCLSEIHSLLPVLAADVYDKFINKVHDATSRLTHTPTSVEEFAGFLELLTHVEGSKEEMSQEHDMVNAHYDLMEEFGIQVPALQYAGYQAMMSDVVRLKDALWNADGARDKLSATFKKDLENQVEVLNKQLLDIRLLAQHDMVLDENSVEQTVVSYTGELVAQVQEQRRAAESINKFQRQFKLEETRFQELADCAEDINLRHSLWAGRIEWRRLTNQWRVTTLDSIDAQRMEDAVLRHHRLVTKLERDLVPNKVVPSLREGVDEWRELLPVVTALRNRDLRERHWAKIEEVLGAPIERGDTLTMEGLLNLRLTTLVDSIVGISTEASQEASLEDIMEKVADKWRSVEFMVLPYKDMKDTYILGGVDDVMIVLEDSMVLMSTILASRFVAGIRTEVERLEKQLRLFSDTLDEWVECQRQWLYLETIFMAPDIQRQLPAEAKAFTSVDRQFKDLMRKVRDRPNALAAGTQPNMIETLSKCNETMENVQKNLEDYLETKRVAFPRFYFLSNDELLEILSQTRNPQAVQPHLQKCFDGIRVLDFGDDSKSTDIFAMVSGEGERVVLGKSLKARGGVEAWLTLVEGGMRTTMRALARRGVKDYPTIARTAWVSAYPGQLVLLICAVYWCRAVEKALAEKNSIMALELFLDECVGNLRDLTKMVQDPGLGGLERKILVALITIDVHSRDIVELLIQQKVSSTKDFSWIMQLRYDVEGESEEVVVKQVNARFDYSYEYLGCQPRLVVTPMTDRCYMTLTGALHMRLGGAPAGPAGTGKTETTKDLGKALGVQCVVFNCGENLDYKFMGKFFSGLAQCGAWACFDEFNRIDVEVLSVVAQQLMSLQGALRAGVDRFLFEGQEIRLVRTCGVFITMNPGYAGRTELPDNLKALFRPMAMMIPDYALVAEVMLFSEGFSTAKVLSRKMVRLYKLSSEQLSQQDHYDFGMRALKSVLVMAGSLKRARPKDDEEVVLIRAMTQANIPKFLSEDARLFRAIVSDLFPGVAAEEQDYGQLAEAVVAACHERGLQPVPPFMTKVLQLHETFNVRFGVMLVGPTGGGKSAVYRVLAGAKTALREKKHPDPEFQPVQVSVLNPKAVPLGALYGQYSPLTNEWADGLASTLIRHASADTSEDHKWVVLDGPVDAVWVENMNTVLDDNCMLCLPNGERIKLNPVTMRILFEVGDLSAASPATVSRCGMVYVTPEDMGWAHYIKSWLESLPKILSDNPDMPVKVCPDIPAHLNDLFNNHFPFLLASLRARQGEGDILPDVHHASTAAALLQSMLMKPHLPLSLDMIALDDGARIALAYMFAFACVWGLGGTLDAAAREAFDNPVRSTFDGVANFPGGSGICFDYYLDPERAYTFVTWDSLVPKYKYSASTPYFQILVPTAETVRINWLMSVCMNTHRPVLLTGPSGVGKSVVVLDNLSRAVDNNVKTVVLNFSAHSSAATAQATIEASLEKKRKKRYGAPAGKRLVVFVDDINMPQRETWGAQPPLELLRQLVDCGGFYDTRKLFWKEVEGTTMVGCAGPPGGGRTPVPTRLARHFMIMGVPPPSETALRTIFGSILGGYFDHYFTSDVRSRLLRPMVDCAVEVYLRVSAELLPTPTKSHYTFNTRDLSALFQGITSILPTQCPDPRTTLMRLWLHETLRVFHDRLTTNDDRKYLTTMLYELLRIRFDAREEYEELFDEREVLFADFARMGIAREDRLYAEITGGYPELRTLLERHLEEYNGQPGSGAGLSLVFFKDAMAHIARLARILRQPRGNAMLVGVGGSGKQTLARFASFVSDTKAFSIELTRIYGLPEFREDLKKLYRITGVEGKHVAFLFTDSHIVNDSFVEDINNLLNSGEVTDLFNINERDRILAEISPWAEARGIDTGRESLWRAFIARVRDNLHLMLAMSPVGDAFRNRCRRFPSLINCCAIDWFSEWPHDALISVSSAFLADQELGNFRLNTLLADMCVTVHTSVAAMADKFYQELRRRYYVTPKSYLDLIRSYVSLLSTRRREVAGARGRLLDGLSKLKDTNEVVDKMTQELSELQPVLEQKKLDTQALLVQVSTQQRDAEAIRSRVTDEEMEVKTKAVETSVLKDDAQRDLDEVLPAMEGAERALSALNKSDIIEIKTFTKPPPLVQLTMEAICILLQEKPDWETAKRVLGDAGFIRRLMEYDKDNIPERVLRSLKRIIDDPMFSPDQVMKQSKAAMSMCLWVRAMDTYSSVVAVVEPKRVALREAQAALDAMNAALANKQLQLREVEERVSRLQRQLETTREELNALSSQAELTSKRLGRAERLVRGLGDEATRWAATAEELGERAYALVGDVFLAAAATTYIGVFTGPYREALLSSWLSSVGAAGVPHTPVFSLESTLVGGVEVREWRIQGLPADSTSTDNGVLVTRGSRWPLCIDPQGQANRWFKAMEAKAGLRCVRPSDPNLLRTLESAVRIGNPVLLEELGESLEGSLDPLLARHTVAQGARVLIRLGDSDVDYDPGFKLYMTTKLPNPHYLPEVCIKVNLINFTVTLKGLEEQLLGDAVRAERPELEEQRDRLVLSISSDRRTLNDLEDRILKLLRDAAGNILDDEVLISTLNNSKTTAAVVQSRVQEAEETEAAINIARDVYRPAPVRGTVLFSAISELSSLDPMYQNSLAAFTGLFNACLLQAPRSENLETRLANIINTTTATITRVICRGLFEDHRLIFTFMVATAIARHPSTGPAIPHNEWDFLLRGGRVPDSRPPMPLDAPWWLTPNIWDSFNAAQATLPAIFPRLISCVTERKEALREIVTIPKPLANATWGMISGAIGDGRGNSLTIFQRLLLLKMMCEGRFVSVVEEYVSETLGPSFLEWPTVNMGEIYTDSSPSTPIIFILSQGANPAASLIRYGESLGYRLGTGLHIISLGQGQGPFAETTLNHAARNGQWVVLQNCHLARSWMPRLERIVEELGVRVEKQAQLQALLGSDMGSESGTVSPTATPPATPSAAAVQSADIVHPDFRMWLTSQPSPHFPVPVLQAGVKVSLEPPRGVRGHLLRSYGQLMDETDLEYKEVGGVGEAAWRTLVFATTFFHAIIQDRRKFGPLGWNIPYEFSDGDLLCALSTLNMFLDTASDIEHIPWRALHYVMGEINYGGRVTDDNDRVTLMAILRHTLKPGLLLTGEAAKKLGDGRYPRPPAGSRDDVLAAIRLLPAADLPDVFGLHANADVSLQAQASRRILETVLSLQPRVAVTGSSGQGIEEVVEGLVEDILALLPPPFDRSTACLVRDPFATLASGHDNSLGTVLQQEMARFNGLMALMRRSLSELSRAIKGMAVMSSDLEAMSTAFMNNQVPENWSAASYPSLKPLGSWVRDLGRRLDFISQWLTEGQPASIWLPALFFPQGFFTAVLQNTARSTYTPIDSLSFAFTVQNTSEPLDVGKYSDQDPTNGVLVHGLYLEGARWISKEDSTGYLGESEPGHMYSRLPLIHFKPIKDYNTPEDEYQCPLYKMAARTGTLSTTGQSTNFVLHISLPIMPGTTRDVWVLQGVAALCALSD